MRLVLIKMLKYINMCTIYVYVHVYKIPNTRIIIQLSKKDVTYNCIKEIEKNGKEIQKCENGIYVKSI